MSEINFENDDRVVRKWNEIFEALSAEPRRQIVLSLVDSPPDRTVPLPESAVTPDVPVDPEPLRTELHHHHLPLLAESRFVEWRDDPFVATRGPRFDEVAAVFEALESDATAIPDSLVVGCQRLERAREESLRGD